MQLVERHVIRKNHRFFKECDRLCFASKNLYNRANYIVRQSFIHKNQYLNYNKIQKQLQSGDCYKALPAKVSQQTLKLLEKNWKSFFEANKIHKEDPSRFLGKPKIPKYKDVTRGRNACVYTIQAISKTALKKRGIVSPSQTSIKIKTTLSYEAICQVRITPKLGHYIVEIVYEHNANDLELNKDNMASIDLGVDNLAAVTSNKPGFKPILVNGRLVKSINQYYNKRKAELQACLPKGKGTTTRIQKLSTKRNFRVDNYLHLASRFIVDSLISNNIGSLIIGKNDGWKQKLNIGKQNNQNFICLPHDKFIHQLRYKAELVGIQVITTEESYSSKASFLDLDPIPVYQKGKKYRFSGRRIKRGLYKASNGRRINADVNGSFNIMRKVSPSMFLTEGLEGVVVRPVKVTLSN